MRIGGSVTVVMIGVALWGLHMGLTQGLLAALVADTAPEELRGTAFGMFNLVSGIAMLAASVIAGALWDVDRPGRHVPRRRGIHRARAGGAAFRALARRQDQAKLMPTSPPSASSPRA